MNDNAVPILLGTFRQAEYWVDRNGTGHALVDMRRDYLENVLWFPAGQTRKILRSRVPGRKQPAIPGWLRPSRGFPKTSPRSGVNDALEWSPKGTDLGVHTAEHLALVADQLNRRPHEVLGWESFPGRQAVPGGTDRQPVAVRGPQGRPGNRPAAGLADQETHQ